MNKLRPIKRSKFRILLGKLFFRIIRYKDWYFGDKIFSKTIQSGLLPHTIFLHQTPLLRKLKDVDMWMQHNKVKNIEIAIKCLNGIIVNPGETFSYWNLIGKPSRRKGYLKGMILYYGRFYAGTGGGLCQLSNLIYWITLHTPLIVTERYRHSYDVFPDSNRSQPFGSGATCVYNYRDLQILNETHESYQLHLYLNEGFLCGEWRAENKPILRYEIYEKEHFMNHEIWGGYSRNNKISRKIFGAENSLIADEYITENQAIMMYPPFISEPNPNKEEVLPL